MTNSLQRAGSLASGHSSWDATFLDRSADLGPTTAGRDGGATTRPTMPQPSCSRTTPGHRSPWKAAPPSTSSPMAFMPPCNPRRDRSCQWSRYPAYGAGSLRSRQYLRAGLIDEMHFAIAPILPRCRGTLAWRHRHPKARLSGAPNTWPRRTLRPHAVLTKGS